MVNEIEKIQKAKNVLLKMAKGIDPLTGETISEDSYLNDPRIIRCLYFVTEVLDDVLHAPLSNLQAKKRAKFMITPEQKAKVVLKKGLIGMNEFTDCLNMCIDTNKVRRLSGTLINKKLKEMGILGQQEKDGKTKTIINESSLQYGFEMMKSVYDGVEYEKLVINDEGKRFLLDNLEGILSYKLNE